MKPPRGFGGWLVGHILPSKVQQRVHSKNDRFDKGQLQFKRQGVKLVVERKQMG